MTHAGARPRAFLAFTVALAVVASACATTAPTTPPAAASAAPATPAAASAAPATPAVAIKSLKVSPETGFVGTPITITGEGLPPGQAVELLWDTIDGSFDMKPSAENVEYYDRKFTAKRVPLARASVGADGRLSASTAIPDDYGEVHDIYAVIDGKDVARGGFAMTRNVTVSPLSGPVGTPLTITVKGLGWTTFANTMGVLWDNHYVGFITAVTTRGTAVATIRAAGAPGRHELRVTDASAAMPYLNHEQSPRKLPQYRFDFRVTEDAGPPPASLDWPDDARVATKVTTRTTASATAPAGSGQASFSPASGPILTRTTLKASGLPAGAALDLIWMSVKGSRPSPSGWSLVTVPLGKGTAASDGTLSASLQIPDDLGGWHVLKVVQGEKTLAEAPFYLERSFVSVTPAKVRAGETFTVHIKGIGWTEFDNGVAMIYDNSFVGYACGFNSQGDVKMNIVASGAPGTHLIDLYPMLYLGHGKGPWSYSIPFLSFAQDYPGLSLGYRLPVYRLAIEVVR